MLHKLNNDIKKRKLISNSRFTNVNTNSSPEFYKCNNQTTLPYSFNICFIRLPAKEIVTFSFICLILC